jgi:hypothetical protein
MIKQVKKSSKSLFVDNPVMVTSDLNKIDRPSKLTIAEKFNDPQQIFCIQLQKSGNNDMD